MRYVTGITPQKGKQNKSRSSRPNNSMSDDENEKKFKKNCKKDRT
jgi:hypothetical protein